MNRRSTIYVEKLMTLDILTFHENRWNILYFHSQKMETLAFQLKLREHEYLILYLNYFYYFVSHGHQKKGMYLVSKMLSIVTFLALMCVILMLQILKEASVLGSNYSLRKTGKIHLLIC